MIKLDDRYVVLLDADIINCYQCAESFGTADDPDVEGDWDCVVGKNGLLYHSGCCVEAGKNQRIKSQKIIDWFEMICKGIRTEYEEGASHRDLEIDKNTLAELLRDELDEKS